MIVSCVIIHQYSLLLIRDAHPISKRKTRKNDYQETQIAEKFEHVAQQHNMHSAKRNFPTSVSDAFAREVISGAKHCNSRDTQFIFPDELSRELSKQKKKQCTHVAEVFL